MLPSTRTHTTLTELTICVYFSWCFSTKNFWLKSLTVAHVRMMFYTKSLDLYSLRPSLVTLCVTTAFKDSSCSGTQFYAKQSCNGFSRINECFNEIIVVVDFASHIFIRRQIPNNNNIMRNYSCHNHEHTRTHTTNHRTIWSYCWSIYFVIEFYPYPYLWF